MSDEEKKKKKEEIERIKAAGKRAWKIHQGKASKAKSNGKPPKK